MGACAQTVGFLFEEGQQANSRALQQHPKSDVLQAQIGSFTFTSTVDQLEHLPGKSSGDWRNLVSLALWVMKRPCEYHIGSCDLDHHNLFTIVSHLQLIGSGIFCVWHSRGKQPSASLAT